MFKRGWEVELQDGTILREGQAEWREIPKIKIARLSLFFDGRRWDLTGKQAYFVMTRASVSPGRDDSLAVEARVIGYYEGANKICYTVNERTGEFKLGVIDGR